MSALPDRFRELLVLRELEGLSSREVADAMDIPMGTVMSGLSRARQALRGVLDGESSRFNTPERTRTSARAGAFRLPDAHAHTTAGVLEPALAAAGAGRHSDRYAASNEKICTRCRPALRSARAERAKRLCQPARGSAGISGAWPLAGSRRGGLVNVVTSGWHGSLPPTMVGEHFHRYGIVGESRADRRCDSAHRVSGGPLAAPY